MVKTPDFCIFFCIFWFFFFFFFFDFLVSEGYLGCSEQASKTLVKKKNFFFFFEIFEKSADFATKFGWGISATKGSPLWKKNEIDQKRYPNISVFFGFHFVL